MGAYWRADSKWWWLYLETIKRKERTKILVGVTTAQRHDSKKLAEAVYHQRMTELAGRLYHLPTAQPSIRFDKYAATYATDTIAHRRGAERELNALIPLRSFLGSDLIAAIDKDRVKQYRTWRLATVSAATVNREVGVLKTMLRDAAPKFLTASPLVRMPQLKEIPPKRRLLARDEERRLLSVATDPQDYGLIVLGMDTLIRQGDLLDVTRADVVGKWLYVANPKSGEPYEVALTKRAASALKAIRHDKPHYFEKFRRAANPRDWRGAVRQRLEVLCKAADVPFGKAAKGITFHWATRRTGASRLLMKKHVPLPVVQRMGNWKKPAVLLEIYSEADRNDMLAAVGQAFPKRSRSKRKTA